MTDYYKLLGLRHTATAAEIKRAYRQLAVKYHPDKNPDLNAAEYFKELTFAYTVLSDERKKWVYDQQLYRAEHNVAQPPKPQHRDPAYRPSRPKVYRKSERQRMRELMEQYLPYVLNVSRVALFFCLFLIADYLLPFSARDEVIVEKYSHVEKVRGGRGFHSSDILITEAGNSYKIPIEDTKHFAVGSTVSVYVSRLIRVPIVIISANGLKSRFGATIYGNFMFAPLILLITSALGSFLYQRSSVEFYFNLGVVNCFILFLNIFFLFSHKFFL